MKIFHIYTNLLKDTGGETTAYIRNYLEERGCICKDQVDGTVEGIIVLGGDGTMLRAAGEYLGRHIPMIGVNLGTLGYLAEVEQDQIETALDSLIADKYEVESRMMLSGIPVIAGESMAPMIALNDIVITRKGALHVINFNIYVNGQLLSTYNADGMIISTPTGSTAYNLSAGGPIVEPKARLILMTPVCSHTLVNDRTIILSEDDVIDVEIGRFKQDEEQEVDASFDGRHPVNLNEGDKIRIIRSDKATKIMKLSKVSFLDTLQKKMRVDERFGNRMKRQRHEVVVDLINKYDIETQEELAAYLKEEGFEVTQATVSRDIRELKLSKIATGNGKQKYIILKNDDSHLGDKYIRVLRDGFVSMNMAQNILVIKTVQGMAMAVAAALDAMKFPEIVGCIAGDDTIMAAIKSTDETKVVIDKINEILEG